MKYLIAFLFILVSLNSFADTKNFLKQAEQIQTEENKNGLGHLTYWDYKNLSESEKRAYVVGNLDATQQMFNLLAKDIGLRSFISYKDAVAAVDNYVNTTKDPVWYELHTFVLFLEMTHCTSNCS